MHRTIMVLLCSVFAADAAPRPVPEYVLKLEVTNDSTTVTVTIPGKEKIDKESDVRTLEFLVARNRRFHAKTSWADDYLFAKGKLADTDDGKLRLEIDFGQFHKTGDFLSKPDGSKQEIEDGRRVATAIELEPGKPVILAGFMSQTVSNHVTDGATTELHGNEKAVFQVTLIEVDAVE
ncbi:MAG TPA: hypothetical protein VGM05_16540 [Planctomycetaceae bacterium]